MRFVLIQCLLGNPFTRTIVPQPVPASCDPVPRLNKTGATLTVAPDPLAANASRNERMIRRCHLQGSQLLSTSGE